MLFLRGSMCRFSPQGFHSCFEQVKDYLQVQKINQSLDTIFYPLVELVRPFYNLSNHFKNQLDLFRVGQTIFEQPHKFLEIFQKRTSHFEKWLDCFEKQSSHFSKWLDHIGYYLIVSTTMRPFWLLSRFYPIFVLWSFISFFCSFGFVQVVGVL